MGARIAALRGSLGISQEALAAAAEVKQVSVSRWERGKGEPSATELVGLAGALGVNIHYLVTGEGREEPPGVEEQGSYGAGIRYMIQRLRELATEVEVTSADAVLEAARRARAERVETRHRQVQADKARSDQQQRQPRKKRDRG